MVDSVMDIMIKLFKDEEGLFQGGEYERVGGRILDILGHLPYEERVRQHGYTEPSSKIPDTDWNLSDYQEKRDTDINMDNMVNLLDIITLLNEEGAREIFSSDDLLRVKYEALHE